MPLEAEVGLLAARQFGLIARFQAVEAGLSEDTIQWQIRTRAWERTLPSVYRLRGAPRVWPQPLMAAQLWAWPNAVVSHRAAAACWGLDGVEPGIVEVSILGSSRAAGPGGVVVHRSATLRRSDFGYLGPFLVTGLVRTLIDLGAVVEDSAVVEAAMESALRMRPDLLEPLAARLEELPRHGRGGAGVLRAILQARDPREAPTEGIFETRLLRLITKAGLPRPVRQHWVSAGEKPYRIDFAWPVERVGLEADGRRSHTGREAFEYGLRRGNALTLLGWRMIHVSWQDLKNRPEYVTGLVRDALAGERARS
jgi:very-short-patch-repair endonuclease